MPQAGSILGTVSALGAATVCAAGAVWPLWPASATRAAFPAQKTCCHGSMRAHELLTNSRARPLRDPNVGRHWYPTGISPREDTPRHVSAAAPCHSIGLGLNILTVHELGFDPALSACAYLQQRCCGATHRTHARTQAACVRVAPPPAWLRRLPWACARWRGPRRPARTARRAWWARARPA